MSERVIRQLLAEAGHAPSGTMARTAQRRRSRRRDREIGSPETYIGYYRAERFVSPGGLVHDSAKPTRLPRWRSTNGPSKARGSINAERALAWRWREASPFASTRATCIWSWDRRRGKPVRFG